MLNIMWYVYILHCADGTLYTGATSDLVRRLRIHNGEEKGSEAKYTKARRPVMLAYSSVFPDKSSAMKREWEIKQLTRVEKLTLINQSGGSS